MTKALRKDKDERYQTVREMLGDLKDLKAELDSQTRRDRSASSEDESGTQSTARREEAVIETASIGDARPTKQGLQITSNATAWAFDCSPDGQWIVFDRAQAGKTAICKVSIEGGAPVQLTDIEMVAPAFSPEGNLSPALI